MPDVHAVERHGAALNVVETGQQLHQGTFAMARGADNRQHFAGLDLQVQVLDHRVFAPGVVGEPHLFETDLAPGPLHALGLGRVEDLGPGVQQQKDPLRRG